MAVNTIIGTAPRFIIETSVMVMIAVITVYFAQQPGGLVAAIPVLGALAIGAQRLLPLVHLSYLGWTAFASKSRILIDVAELLELPILKSPGALDDRRTLPFEDAIAFNDVMFRYQENAPALRNVDLTIARGERIGFVGKTGSGKSTMIDLLLGLLQPTDGTIAIDGTTLDEDNVAQWQAQIAHVPQAIFLSDGSIASNIAFGVPQDAVDLERGPRRGAAGRISTPSSWINRADTKRPWANAACGFPAASASASASPARCIKGPPCWYSTRRPAHWTKPPRPRSWNPSTGWIAT